MRTWHQKRAAETGGAVVEPRLLVSLGVRRKERGELADSVEPFSSGGLSATVFVVHHAP